MPDPQLTSADENLPGNIATKVLTYGTITLAAVALVMITGGTWVGTVIVDLSKL